MARVADAAEEITVSGDLSRRLHYEGPDDEVGRLSRTVDGMLDRLETVFRDRAELLADVSHQLRTPLTIVRGHLEVLSHSGYGDPEEVAETVALVIDELDQLALMVERMLLLGQALERDFLVEEPVELPALLDEVLEASRFLGERDWVLGPVFVRWHGVQPPTRSPKGYRPARCPFWQRKPATAHPEGARGEPNATSRLSHLSAVVP